MNPEKPVALVHTYGNDLEYGKRHGRKDKDYVKPDLRGRLQALAVMELKRQGLVSNIILTGGSTNIGEPTLSEVTTEQLKRNSSHLEYKEITCLPWARNTIQEVSICRDILKYEGWNNVVVLGNETHLRRIQRNAKRKFGRANVTFIATERLLAPEDEGEHKSRNVYEEVLKNSRHSRRYRKIIESLRNSSNEAAFKKQESNLNLIDMIPIFGEWFFNTVTSRMSQKGNIQANISK